VNIYHFDEIASFSGTMGLSHRTVYQYCGNKIQEACTMAGKNTARVIIGGKIITLGGYETEEYFQKVASYINNKIDELSEMPGYSRQPVDMRHLLLSLNIADDRFKAKNQVEAYEADLHQKDQEMYDLKHELVSLRMQVDEIKEQLLKAQNEKTTLEGRVRELEKELEDMLK
jgi:cell division protein ZapA